MFLKILENLQENNYVRAFFLNNVAGACNIIKKEALVQVFSCEFCEIFKNTFFTEHLRWLLLYIEDLCISYKNLIIT